MAGGEKKGNEMSDIFFKLIDTNFTHLLKPISIKFRANRLKGVDCYKEHTKQG